MARLILLPGSRGDLWLRDDLEGGWHAYYRLIVQHGVPVVAEVHVTARDAWWLEAPELVADSTPKPARVPRGGLSARTIRQLRPASSMADLRAPELRRLVRDLALGGGAWDELVAQLPRVREPRLHRLARVAELYVVGLARRKPRINAAIGQELGRSASQVRDDVHAARTAGLLTDGPGQGRPGGELTDKARRILADLHGKQGG